MKSTPLTFLHSLLLVLFPAVTFVILGCGGGGGGDDLSISGTIIRVSATTTTVATAAALTAEPRLGLSATEAAGGRVDIRSCPTDGTEIQICVSGSCVPTSKPRKLKDGKSDWDLSIPLGESKLKFEFTGCDVDASKSISGVKATTRTMLVDWEIAGGETAQATSVCQLDKDRFLVKGTESTCVIAATTTTVAQ